MMTRTAKLIPKLIRMGALIGGLALFAPTPVWAADEAAPAAEGGEEGVIYKKKTTINFDDDTIDGDLTRPDGAYLDSRKRVRHSNLIKIRENWRDKVMQASGEL